MLTRIAYQIVERNRGAESLELIGIRERGTALARALADEIRRIEARLFTVHELDVTPYRDDRDRSAAAEDHSRVEADVTDRDVILIDDVLFTGRTARAALDAVVHFGRPRTIQLLVLVDRGHREYPIQPDYVGRVIQTKHKERVVVDVDAGFAVYIEE
jgi:pyrimidine operon attenuation protein/uracil phosphoribosyltransferase